ncbi:hypothetical protein VTJ04DRAFT_134 [Mycothermus thermophilus]|uniref:uncharacterized protein n=1 Tax=Humicola insolens TaxID=85995 RepID=UPI0037445075
MADVKFTTCGHDSTCPAKNEPEQQLSTPPNSPALIQAWKQFWPPSPGSETYTRLQREHPEVLTCQHDTKQPFERPWRGWNDTTFVDGVGLALSHTSPPSCNLACQRSAAARLEIQEERRALDEQIGHFKLPYVVPETFYHLAPLELYQREKPYKCQLPKGCFPGLKLHNLHAQSYKVTISEVTGHEHLFSLSVSGFEFVKCPIAMREWSDEAVLAKYLPGIIEWLKKHLNCRDVYCYAYNFRHHGPSQKQPGQKQDFKRPFFRAHCDASESTCQARMKLYFPDNYSDLMRERVRFINVWRPICPTPVADCPLAMCDFRTFDREDLVPMDIVYPHFVDEAYEVRYNPAHRWFYKKGMTQEDAIIFKLYDSLTSEATVCPHSAFVDPTAPKDAPARASIEVKAIILG